MSFERTLRHIWSNGCVLWRVRMIAINWLSRLCWYLSHWTWEFGRLMDQCRRHCPCKNKYELFKNSASPKRNSAEKTQGKYQCRLILPWTTTTKKISIGDTVHVRTNMNFLRNRRVLSETQLKKLRVNIKCRLILPCTKKKVWKGKVCFDIVYVFASLKEVVPFPREFKLKQFI